MNAGQTPISRAESQKYSTDACWIWSEKEVSEAWYMFRRTFPMPQAVRSAKLLVTAGGYHETYINGEIVARQLAKSYKFSKYYDVIDVMPYLKKGKDNVIAILSPELSGKGVLAELLLYTIEDTVIHIPSDSSWRVKRHDSFIAGMPHYSIPLGPEECYDARIEDTGWNEVDFDDSGWEHAKELDPVGTPPWTGMEASNIGLPGSDTVFPKRFGAIELAYPKRGYRFRLSSASSCMKAFVTEVSCKTAASMKLWFESVIPQISLNGKAVNQGSEVQLSEGTNFLCCCLYSPWGRELEVLIETDAILSFNAGSVIKAESAQWAVIDIPTLSIKYPWHENSTSIIGDAEKINKSLKTMSSIASVSSASEFPKEILDDFKPAQNNESSIYNYVKSQNFYKVSGGFTDPAIEKGCPRIKLDDSYGMPIINSRNLLHNHADVSTIVPQKDKDVHFIVDFGREYIGFVQLSLDAPAGTVVDIQCFELVEGQGIFWMDVHNGFRYICRDGYQTFTTHYRRGFRYVSVTLRKFDRPVYFRNICCIHSSYPVQEIGGFECSDALLNKIYRMSVDTAALCMLDTYVDCPGHEQNFWVGDSRITALINLITYGGYDLNQRSIRMVGQSLSIDWVKEYWPKDDRYLKGKYLPIAAYPNYPEGCLPMWTFLWINQCWEHYLHSGNMNDLKENYGYAADTLNRCNVLTNERGLFDMPGAWNLIEWGYNDLSPYGEVTANNVLLVRCLHNAAKMACALGYEEQADKFMKEAEQRTSAINKYCWDDELNAYVDTVRDSWAFERYVQYCSENGRTPETWEMYSGCKRISEQTNTLALICDCVPTHRMEHIMKIVERVEIGRYVAGAPSERTHGVPSDKEAPDGIVAIGSPFFLFFSLEALFRLNNPNAAVKVMKRDWGNMADKGTNTCWETFQYNDAHWTRSICHAWSAAPAFYLPSHVLGIRPVEPGYKKFIVDPYTSELNWARGSVATPYGPIYVNWSKGSDGEADISCSMPEQCERVIKE